ncbi:MAG: orotidine-5'-phosphate decarboxylase [Candidatus Omnitrophota bacterium]
MKKETKLIVALDTDSLETAEGFVKILSPKVKYFKIGSQLFTMYGPKCVEMVKKYKGEVFLDLKFHDIPNTVANASISAVRLGVFMLNMHAIGGEVMLKTVMEKVKEECERSKVKQPIILGVTVLTSMDRQQLNSVGVIRSVKNEVVHLAGLCKKCGLNGVVCSGKEIELLKRVMGDDFVLVVPGIRPADSSTNDQKRIVTPTDAKKLGADYIVVGRPIVASKDPLKSAESILEQISI